MIRNEDDPFWVEYWNTVELDCVRATLSDGNDPYPSMFAEKDTTPRWVRWAWKMIDRIGRIKMIGMGQHGIIQRERDC